MNEGVPLRLDYFNRGGVRLLVTMSIALFAMPEPGAAHGSEGAHTRGGSGHAKSDAYYAALAKDFEPFAAPALPPPAPEDLITVGTWGPVLPWPHIPVSAASLPDGRILTYAASQGTDSPEGPEYTVAAVWDPVTGINQTVDHDQHDMFCGHLVMLEDGRVFVSGGRNTVPLTSIFDFQTDQWTLSDSMHRGRWYPTTVYLPDGEVFTARGLDGGDNPERWREGVGWQDMPGVDLGAFQLSNRHESDWWPYLHLDPKGKLIHTGPVATMHRVDPYGAGAVESLGPWLPSSIWYPKQSATTIYDIGKVIVAGGDKSGGSQAGSTNRVVTFDLNGPTPTSLEVSPMAFARRYANAVMLPDGKVLVVGGNTSGIRYDDTTSILTPEIWDPVTDTWTTVAPHAIPRNYHSVALLLSDGRVFSGGGGLCDCAANHLDAQIYSPPYLYAADGTPALRPNVVATPSAVRNGEVFSVTASPGVDRFTMIRMSATTHAVNTDLRFIEVPFTDEGGGTYHLTTHPNRDVALPGYWMLFALSGGVPSLGQVVQVSTANAPQVIHPGPFRDVAGNPVSRVIEATDPNGDALTWSATGLPPGLSISSTTGEISGTLAAGSEGDYEVVVDIQDLDGGPTLHIDWTVLPSGLGSGFIRREWWDGLPGASVADLTSAPTYPATPDGSDLLPRFEGPTDWKEGYGTRMRGSVHPPVSGDYQFYIASGDASELWLSTDATPGNAVLVANVSGSTDPEDFTNSSAQDSGPIPLVAGQHYYIEALHKGGSGTQDHLAVAWETPDAPLALLDGAYLSPYPRNPDIAPVPDQHSVEGDSPSLQIIATHPTGATLSYSASALPPGLAIDSVSGLLSGTIAAASAGAYAATVTVDDGTTSSQIPIAWTVSIPGICGNGIVEGGEDCDGTPCCTSCTFDGPGTACDDANVCTVGDQCNGGGTCAPGTALDCNDGTFCNGAETCDPLSGCVSGTPPIVDDGVPCTSDLCDEIADVVLHTPVDALCADGLFCNGDEVCDVVAGCGAGAPVLLDDGVACTTDTCDEATDTVLHAPDASACEDEDVCTTFVCDPLAGCLDTGPPLEAGPVCSVPVPALPPSGLLFTALGLAGVGAGAMWRLRARQEQPHS